MKISRILSISAPLLVLTLQSGVAVAPDKAPLDRPEPSAMGALFMGLTPLPSWLDSIEEPTVKPPIVLSSFWLGDKDAAQADVNATPGVTRFQSETTIAAAGNQVVAGFNDASGFSNPAGISVSGFSYSSDGGQSFTYGGQLPLVGGGDAVRGDPDVKVWVDPQSQQATFVYSSLYRTVGGDFSLCVHVSTDGGMTWAGPREVTTVTSSTDFADKEFLDVDPETGRLLLSWTSFGSSLEMRTTYSDDFGLNWASYTVFSARPEDGQGSCPRFDPTSDNAYIVWRSFGSPSAISFVRSTDNGATWGNPQNIITGVNTPRPPFGSDRINGFPALAVSPFDGDLHLIYASRETADFGDVYYSRSQNNGTTWTSPVALNANPGNDRAQFFCWISVNDTAPERIDAIWYDQRAGTEGSDLTDVVHAHSSDGGTIWSPAVALTLQPFHAEYGQDTGQPNIGDYNQCFSQGSILLACYARSGVADYQTLAPDAYVASNDGTLPAAALRLDDVTVIDLGCESDGLLVAGEVADLLLTIASDQGTMVTPVDGLLTTTTPGVTILTPTLLAFSIISPFGTGTNLEPLLVRLDDAYPCGQPIDFQLTGTAIEGDWGFQFSLPTGTETGAVTLLSEDFDAVGSGLPAGWTHVQRKGFSNPWEVSSSFSSSGSNSLFCDDVADTNWSRVESPALVIPGDAVLVEVSFKVTYDIEEVGDGRQGYDGALLKINIDGTDVLAGAFSTLFEGQYRTQIIRGSGSTSNPLQDLSAWSGDALPDFEPIRIQYPGLAGTTVQLAFEMGSDIAAGGTGIFVDDIAVRSLPRECGSCSAAPLLAVVPTDMIFTGVPVNGTSCQTVTIRNDGDGFMDILSVTGCDSPPFSLDLTELDFEVFPQDSTSFQVCVTPTEQGPDTCFVTIETDAGTQVVTVINDAVTDVPGAAQLPSALTVSPVFPNPFNPRVQVRFGLPAAGPVSVAVYDVAGRKVRDLLVREHRAAGFHDLIWDGMDVSGRAAASGIYVFHIRAAGDARSVRGTLVR